MPRINQNASGILNRTLIGLMRLIFTVKKAQSSASSPISVLIFQPLPNRRMIRKAGVRNSMSVQVTKLFGMEDLVYSQKAVRQSLRKPKPRRRLMRNGIEIAANDYWQPRLMDEVRRLLQIAVVFHRLVKGRQPA